MVYLILFLFSGIAIANSILDKEQSLVTRLWFGLTLGCLELLWLPSAFGLIIGRFTQLEQILALVVATLTAVGCIVWQCLSYKKNPQEAMRKPGTKLVSKAEVVGLVMAVLVTALCGYLLHTHVILPFEDGSVHVGQSTYGDLNMHLGMIENLYVQGQFPPEYNIMPGQAINYPFLVNAASATMRFGGLSLRMSVIVPSVVMIFCIALGFFMFVKKLVGKISSTALAMVLFFVNGGFGFIYFLDKLRTDPENFNRIFKAFYETPTNYTAQANVKWVNVICDMIIPQRTTMAGWCVLMAALWLMVEVIQTLAKGDKGVKDYRYFAMLGVIGGLMPMIHTHSFFALGLVTIGVIFTCLPAVIKKGNLKKWLIGFCIFGGITALLAGPQLLTWTFQSTGEEGFLKWHFDWANQDDNWLWFWVKNAGVVFLFTLPALLSLNKEEKRDRLAMAVGSLIIFTVATVAVFQPNYYDNNKLLYVWYMITCAIVADYMVELYGKLKGIGGRQVIAAIVLVAATLSGGLSIGREIVSDYQLLGAEEVQAAEFITENVEPDAVFMAYPNHNNTVAVLTGRRIAVGAGTFLYFHGVNYMERQALVEQMFEDGQCFLENHDTYDINYIYVGPYERSNYDIDYDWFEANCQKIYDQRGVVIYKFN